MKPKRFFFRLGLVVVASLVITTAFAMQAPKSFPIKSQFHVGKSDSLSYVTDMLLQKKIIRSPLLFKIGVVIFNATIKKSVVAGDYVMKEPQNVWTIAYRMVKGQQDLERIKVTIPEGTTAKDIAWILLKNIPNFNAPYFLKIALPYEGHLFPDTYFFYSNVKAEEVLTVFRDAFNTQLSNLEHDTVLSGRKKGDIITMASIIEEEATSSADRALISGVLWKRLDTGMPLQVDAPLAYITSNTTGYFSINETQIDSPYNTYKYKGLPKGPISNPGLDALKASLNPTKSPYFFYLSDKKGGTHYATSYEEHLKNKQKYLK